MCMYVCVGLCVCLSAHMTKDQKTTFKSLFSPSYIFVPGIETIWPVLVARAFTYWIILHSFALLI